LVPRAAVLAHGHSYGDRNCNCASFSITYGYSHGVTDCYANRHAYVHGDSQRYSNNNAYGYCEANADGQGCGDAQVPAHAGAENDASIDRSSKLWEAQAASLRSQEFHNARL
jgi:hypothetical protein